MKKAVLLIVTTLAGLAGCQSTSSRIAQCEAQGISRDTCYLAEQNRQNTFNAAAEKQALENAAQLAQAAHKQTYRGFGVTVVKSGDWVTVEGKPAVVEEKNADAVVYSQGIYHVIFYATGKVALMTNGQFTGYLKK